MLVRKQIDMKTSINTGNFSVTINGDLDAKAQDRILENGVKYELQRGGISSAYVAIAGEKNSKGNNALPKDFARDTVEYNEDNALAMQAAVEEWAKGLFGDSATVEVAKYEGSEAASPMKRATAMVDQFLAQDGGRAALAGLIGVPTDSDRDALIEAANKMGLGIQPPKTAKA